MSKYCYYALFEKRAKKGKLDAKVKLYADDVKTLLAEGFIVQMPKAKAHFGGKNPAKLKVCWDNATSGKALKMYNLVCDYRNDCNDRRRTKLKNKCKKLKNQDWQSDIDSCCEEEDIRNFFDDDDEYDEYYDVYGEEYDYEDDDSNTAV